MRSLALSYNPPRYISRASGRCKLLGPRGGVQRTWGRAAHVCRLKSGRAALRGYFKPGARRRAAPEAGASEPHGNFASRAVLRRGPPRPIRLPWPQCAATTRSSDHGGGRPRAGGRGARGGAVGPRFPPACPVLPLVHPKSICTYSNKSTVVLAGISTESIFSIVVL